MTWCNYIPNILQRICEPTFFVRYNMYIYTITVSKQTFLSTKLSFVRVLKIFLAVFSLITTFFFLFNYALVMLYTIAEILCLPLWLHNIIIDMCPNNIVVLSRALQRVKIFLDHIYYTIFEPKDYFFIFVPVQPATSLCLACVSLN